MGEKHNFGSLVEAGPDNGANIKYIKGKCEQFDTRFVRQNMVIIVACQAHLMYVFAGDPVSLAGDNILSCAWEAGSPLNPLPECRQGTPLDPNRLAKLQQINIILLRQVGSRMPQYI